ncbi:MULTISPECIES: hypothetical protein [Streptomyces]|uniref:Uncharacterized protein n=1 Tax=Streptomyces demainii TaxID=588122 RepID=A0ABT9KJI6_9ACTN|nr:MULTISPECIES: hypothetical protein [Streptomyces]MDP9608554.1 hypothetical protein [Streptomyces demainii]
MVVDPGALFVCHRFLKGDDHTGPTSLDQVRGGAVRLPLGRGQHDASAVVSPPAVEVAYELKEVVYIDVGRFHRQYEVPIMEGYLSVRELISRR